VEGIYKIIYGKLVKLSAQEILDNSEAGSNSGGSLLKSFQYIKDNGIGLQSDYPYTGTKTAFTLNKEGKKRIFIDDYKILQPNYYDEISLMRAVAKQPVVVSVVVGLRFKYYMGGVFKHGLPWINPVSHSLLVVGYGESEEGKYWICKNTYGETWGENGYIYLERNQGTPAGSCGMLSCAYYPVINSDQGVKHAIEKSEIDNVSSPRHHSRYVYFIKL
jgi:C1A family cysteine protease